MRRLIFLFSIISFSNILVPFTPCFSQLEQNKSKIAVLDFDYTGLNQLVVGDIYEQFCLEIEKFEEYSVISRDYMQGIIRQKLPDLAHPITENEDIKIVGDSLGVDLVIAGIVGKVGDAFTITVKLIDVKTYDMREESGRSTGTLGTFLDVSVKEVAEKIIGKSSPPPSVLLPTDDSHKPPIITVTPKKPWYKKWYTWTSGAVVIGVAAIVVLSGDESAEPPAQETLPRPPDFP